MLAVAPAADAAAPHMQGGAGGDAGRHVEFGISIGLGKCTIVIGEVESLFQRPPCAEVVASWNEARDRLVDRPA